MFRCSFYFSVIATLVYLFKADISDEDKEDYDYSDEEDDLDYDYDDEDIDLENIDMDMLDEIEQKLDSIGFVIKLFC